MAARRAGPFRLDHPWAGLGWLSAAGLLTVGLILGVVVLGRAPQNAPPLGRWTAICRGLGMSADLAPAGDPQPPRRTPTRIAWTRATLAQVAGGHLEHGEFVAMNCTACHGEHGVSRSGLFPTLAGMDAAAIDTQLDDFRAGQRSWGAMHAIAHALSAQASADVAAYFASRPHGLTPVLGERFRASWIIGSHFADRGMASRRAPILRGRGGSVLQGWRRMAMRICSGGTQGQRRLWEPPMVMTLTPAGN